jgi:hypothetical protein
VLPHTLLDFSDDSSDRDAELQKIVDEMEKAKREREQMEKEMEDRERQHKDEHFQRWKTCVQLYIERLTALLHALEAPAASSRKKLAFRFDMERAQFKVCCLVLFLLHAHTRRCRGSAQQESEAEHTQTKSLIFLRTILSIYLSIHPSISLSLYLSISISLCRHCCRYTPRRIA